MRIRARRAEARWVWCILVIAGLLCSSWISFADETSRAETEKAYPTEQLDEIVVTATETERTVAEVPQAITVISRDQIDTTGSVNTTDTFQRMPGVVVHDYGSVGFGNQLYIRGYDYLRMYNNLDFQIDGITVHSAGDYGNAVLNTIPRAAINRIEFLRGTAAALYGEQASIGVIDTQLKRRFGPVSAEITGGLGSWNQSYAGIGVTGSTESFSCLLAADYSDGDTYQDYQSYRNRSVLFAPTVQVGTNTKIDGTFLMGDRNVYNPLVTYLTQQQLDQDRQQNFDRGLLQEPVAFVGLGLTHDFDNTLRWVVKSGYLHEREKARLKGDGSGNSWYDWGYTYRADRPFNSYGVESHLSLFDLGTQGSILTAGMEYHFDDATQITSYGGIPDKNAQSGVTDYALFGQYE